MTLPMTAFEICQEYRQAKNKNAQIQILADQNECSKQEIITILTTKGEISGTPQAKSKKKSDFKWTIELETDLIELYEQGFKRAEIAERLGLDVVQVGNKMAKMKAKGYIFERPQKPKAAPPAKPEEPAKPAEPAETPEQTDEDVLRIAARLIKTLEAGGLKLIGLTFAGYDTEIRVEVERYEN